MKKIVIVILGFYDNNGDNNSNNYDNNINNCDSNSNNGNSNTVIVIAVTSYLNYVSPWVGLLFLEKKFKLFKCVFLSNYQSKCMCMHLIKYIDNNFF